MTREEWTSRYVGQLGFVDPSAPLYLEEDKEAERLRWIKWRNRIYILLGRKDTGKANKIISRVWPFPVGTRMR